MVQKSISEEIFKTDRRVNNRPIFVLSKEWAYDILKSFLENDHILGKGRSSKLRLLQCYVLNCNWRYQRLFENCPHSTTASILKTV